MTVKQLIAKLQKLPGSRKVIISKNDPSPLDSVEEGHYRADSTWSGELKHPDDVEDGDEKVVVLHPVN